MPPPVQPAVYLRQAPYVPAAGEPLGAYGLERAPERFEAPRFRKYDKELELDQRSEDNLEEVRQKYLYKKSRPESNIDKREFERDERLRSYNERFGRNRQINSYADDYLDDRKIYYGSNHVNQLQSNNTIFRDSRSAQQPPRAQSRPQAKWTYAEDPYLQAEFQRPLYER